MPEWLKDWWPVLALSVSAISPFMTGWIGWSLNRKFATKEDLAVLEDEVEAAIGAERDKRETSEQAASRQRQEIRERVGQIEADIRHLPSSDDFAKLQVQLTRVEGHLSTVRAQLEGFDALMEKLDRQVQVMDQFLRRQSA